MSAELLKLPSNIYNAKYIRATGRIGYGFGVSGNIFVERGCVGKVINTNYWPDRILVDLAGIGVRSMKTSQIESISEIEYFKGVLESK